MPFITKKINNLSLNYEKHFGLKRKNGKIKFSEQELIAIENNDYAVAITNNLHKKGRTYFLNNNSLLKVPDSEDLFLAYWQDYAKHFKLNMELCLYESI